MDHAVRQNVTHREEQCEANQKSLVIEECTNRGQRESQVHRTERDDGG